MFSRRSSRVKVMQVLYAGSSAAEDSTENLSHQLEESFVRSQQVFFALMDQLVTVAEYALTKQELAITNLLHEDDDVPQLRLMDNPLLQAMSHDEDWSVRLKIEHVNEFHDAALTRHLYKSLKQNKTVKEYISRPTNSPAEDEGVVMAIFYEVLLEDDQMQAWLEEVSAWWPDDAEVITAAAAHIIQHLSKVPLSDQLAQLDEKAAETREFAHDLLHKTIEHAEEAIKLIGPVATNWEIERIATLDMILMRMALVEILEFPTIPVKVTINEYIDISKQYSTPKSKEFINGVLDKLMHRLREEGRIAKSGRGLIET